MPSISSIGSSGLQAAQLRLDASANNVANMNTPGYRRTVVAQQEAADSAGVQASIERFQVPPQAAHLVLVNGVYVEPQARAHTRLGDGDVLAIWPPVAGG